MMEEHPDDRLVFGGAAIVVGVLLIALAMITAFDIRYLFTGTLPFITVGVCLIVYGWYVFNKEVDEKGKSRQRIQCGRTND
jgi:membrane protein implicated in regulation of membrane protease activity